ncbi:hypothetical protein F5Y10DRAFT_261024 [Nemania abortiva]|nr:hypothetical protein F5Y10DRAFT_261024 [Nemania abortiva]
MPSEKVICYDPAQQKVEVFPLSLFKQVTSLSSEKYQKLDLPHLSKTVVIYIEHYQLKDESNDQSEDRSKESGYTWDSKLALCTSRRKAKESMIVAVLHLRSLPLTVKLQRHLHIKSKGLHELQVGSLEPLLRASAEAMMNEKKGPRRSKGILRSWS